MIFSVFLYKNLRFILIFASTGYNFFFSHLVFRIFMHFNADVVAGALTGH